MGVGSILGIFLASAAVALWDVRAAFWLPGVLTAAACGVVAWRFPDLPAASRAPKGRQLLRDLRAQCVVLRQRTLWVLMAVAALSLIAAAISMINAALLSIYPTRFDHCGCVSTVVGLMDFMTYLGAGVSSVVYGRLLAHIGYAGMFLSWLVIALLALILTACARRLGEK